MELGLIFLSLILLADSQLVPISSFAKVVLRCEDTTSSGDSQAITTCQWECYRRCLGGLIAQSDAGVKAMDIMITGDDLKLCLSQLPDHCRLHGSIFSYSTLDYYCAELVSGKVGDASAEGAAPDERSSSGGGVGGAGSSASSSSGAELIYKVNVPQKYSDLNLYATTFAPTDTSLGLSGRVPSDVCLANSGFRVRAVSDQTYSSCAGLTDEASPILAEQNLTYPYFSVNRLDIPIDDVASSLSNFQRGLQTTENHLMITTTTNCYVQKPDVIYLFTKGNFTMTTGTRAKIQGALLYSALVVLTLVFAL